MSIEVTNENFDTEVLKSSTPVMLDFWAPWCGYCHMIAPHLEEISKANAGKVKICKINVDEAQDIATRYTVMSLPTVMLFKDGKVMGQKVGAVSRRELEKLVEPHL
jgi:thioredoxin 1